jgi:hypothetical protein
MVNSLAVDRLKRTVASSEISPQENDEYRKRAMAVKFYTTINFGVNNQLCYTVKHQRGVIFITTNFFL